MAHLGIGDRDLVGAARTGDQVAYAELYRRHVGAVRVAVADNADSPETREDLVQEAFIRALAAIDQLEEPDKFRAWVLQGLSWVLRLSPRVKQPPWPPLAPPLSPQRASGEHSFPCPT